MSTRTIELEAGQAHFSFRVNLGGVSCKFRMNWLERFGYFSVDIDADGERVASGRGLHPEVNLLEGTDIPGQLVLKGSQPTADNLGVENSLRYTDD